MPPRAPFRLPALACLLLVLPSLGPGCGKDEDSGTVRIMVGEKSEHVEDFTAPYWNSRVGAVRAELKQVTKALAENDRASARAAWLQAYRGVFEPQVESVARGRLNDQELARIEYAFGKLGFAIDYLDDKEITESMAQVETILQELPERLSVEVQTAAGGQPALPEDPNAPKRSSTTEEPALAPRAVKR